MEALRQKALSALSGGERQKIYLAMVLTQDTPVILMDEPTTYLDINHQFELLRLIRGLGGQGRTVTRSVWWSGELSLLTTRQRQSLIPMPLTGCSASSPKR